jgi:hypothetical protein
MLFLLQVTRAELEEQSFATKRELAAIKQHDLDTNQQLEIAREKIRKLSEVTYIYLVMLVYLG